MKVAHIPFLLFLSILTFSQAIPVEYKAHKPGRRFELVPIQQEPQEPQHEIAPWEKRDIAALTILFQSLNNSGTIVLARTALQLSLTRDQVCNFVGSFIQTKGLESILSSADQSGLALDLVLMFLTHYETIDGLISVIQYAQNGGGSSSNSTVGNVVSDVGNTVGSAVSGVGSIVGGIVSGIGSIFGIGSGSSLSASTSSSSVVTKYSALNTTPLIASTILSGASKVASNVASITSALSIPLSTQQVSYPTALATTPVSGRSTSTTSTKVAATLTKSSSLASATTTASSGNIVGGVVSGIGSIVSSIFGREDLAEVAEKEGLAGLMKRDDVDTNVLMHELLKRALDENLTPLQKRDALSLIYSQIISIVGTNSNIEEIFESLAKSGLARNVVYNALMDSGFYQFDVQLYKYLVDGKYISLSSVVSAAFSSGLVQSLITTFVKNSAYLKLVINFVLAVLTGKVKVFALLKLIF